jgi:hypothetical protein
MTLVQPPPCSRVPLLVSAVAFGLAACGGGEQPAKKASTAATATASRPQPATQDLAPVGQVQQILETEAPEVVEYEEAEDKPLAAAFPVEATPVAPAIEGLPAPDPVSAGSRLARPRTRSASPRRR